MVKKIVLVKPKQSRPKKAPKPIPPKTPVKPVAQTKKKPLLATPTSSRFKGLMTELNNTKEQTAMQRMRNACAQSHSAKSGGISTRSVKLATPLNPPPITTSAPLGFALNDLTNPEAFKDAIDVDAVAVQPDAAPVTRALEVISLKDTIIVEIRTDTVSERSSEPGINYINKEIMKISNGTKSATPFKRDRLEKDAYTVSLKPKKWLQDAAMAAKNKADQISKEKNTSFNLRKGKNVLKFSKN